MTILDDVTLYVPARNAATTLAPCLSALAQLDPAPTRLFVLVDATSTDETKAIVERSGIESIVQHRPGLAAARNEALLAARTPWVASVDADVVVAPDWLHHLALARELDTNLAGVCGRTEEHLRGLGDLWRALMHPHHWGDTAMMGPFMLISEAMMHRPSVLAVGGYREHLTSYGEDSQLSRDLRDAGFRLAYTPHARAIHVRHDSPRGALDLRWNYAKPRSQSDLEDLQGLLRKHLRNFDFARAAFSRARAAQQNGLQHLANCLPVHHAWRDFAAMLHLRKIPAELAQRLQNQWCQVIAQSVTPHRTWCQSLEILLPELFNGRDDTRNLSANAHPDWPRFPEFLTTLATSFAQWGRDIAALWPHPAPLDLQAPSADCLANWQASFGAPVPIPTPGSPWPALRPFSPWHADGSLPSRSSLPLGSGHWLVDRSAATRSALVDIDLQVHHPDDLPPSRIKISLPHLASYDNPRDVLRIACERAREIEIAYTPPSTLDGGEILFAAELAQACARAGLEVVHFENVVTTTRIRAIQSAAALRWAQVTIQENPRSIAQVSG